MEKKRTRPARSSTLLTLGPEGDAALTELAHRLGRSKADLVRTLVGAGAEVESGYWLMLLVESLILFTEIAEAAGDAGLLQKDEVSAISRPVDSVLQRLYGQVDKFDRFPSIHWTPGQGEARRSYDEVQRLRAVRNHLVAADTEPLKRLLGRFHDHVSAKPLGRKR